MLFLQSMELFRAEEYYDLQQFIDMKKIALFDRLKKKGIFWSYSKNLTLSDMGDEVFIEHLLKYGDFDDIVELFRLYSKDSIFAIWTKALKDDLRFKKLNLFLARLFFDMDVESDYFQGGISERENKFRLLAS